MIESRPRDHDRSLSVQQSDGVGVGRRNQQYPEMRWCTPESGHSGRMAESYSDCSSPTKAVATKAYDAQLTVFEGEEFDVADVVGEWWLCRNGRGLPGWVPRRVLENVAPGDS